MLGCSNLSCAEKGRRKVVWRVVSGSADSEGGADDHSILLAMGTCESDLLVILWPQLACCRHGFFPLYAPRKAQERTQRGAQKVARKARTIPPRSCGCVCVCLLCCVLFLRIMFCCFVVCCVVCE